MLLVILMVLLIIQYEVSH
uniref:Uncharacterized protein n=1 Tax=Anguilla anguilla TaxID=7936 RepID=A0A0E9S998_ANGAN